MITSTVSSLSLRRQCKLLAVPRSRLYYKAKPLNDTELMNQIIEVHLEYPQYGYRRIHAYLQREGLMITASDAGSQSLCSLSQAKEDHSRRGASSFPLPFGRA